MTYPRLEDLAAAVEAWCSENEVKPLSGQAAEVLTLRNLRYYRALGLIDGPAEGAYAEIHFLQLAAVRILQARGQPLKVIQQLLYGRSVKELRRVLKEGVAELDRPGMGQSWPTDLRENWAAIGLPGDWLLISRTGQALTPQQLQSISSILAGQPATLPDSPSTSSSS